MVRKLLSIVFMGMLLFTGLVVSTDAYAQSCPYDAYRGSSVVSAGSRVKLLALSTSDAYYPSRTSIVGKVGRVDRMDSTGDCWFGGQFYGDDGSSYYFYQVAVEIQGASTPASSSCPPGAATDASIPGGSRAKLIGLHPDDAYYSSSASMIGITGTVDGDLHSNDGCWMGGGFVGDDGTSYYFYKGAFTVLSRASAPVATGCPPGAATDASIPGGSRVKLLGLHADDAYYGSSASMIGLTGTVDGDLHSNDGCWMGGGLDGDDGSSYYFYKGAFTVLSYGSGTPVASCPSGAYTGGAPTSGSRVKILTVSGDDAYYSTKYTVEGKAGRVDGYWSKTGEPCWYAGQFYGDDGSSFYFYQAALTLEGGSIGTGTPISAGTGDRYMGTSITWGQKFRVVALHSDDAYYSDRARIIGKHCTADENLPSQGPGWYSGPVTCTDGSTHYFYKVGVVLE